MPLLRLSQFLNLAFASSVIQTVEQKADDTLLAFSNPVMGDALKATMSRQQLLEYNGFAAAAKRCLPKSLETAIEIAQHLETAQNYFETYRAYYEIASLLHLRGKLDDWVISKVPRKHLFCISALKMSKVRIYAEFG